MHSAIKKYLALIVIFTSINAYGAKEESMCSPEEHIYFSCVTENEKILSVCGAEGNEELLDISYRFGRYKTPELIYPPNGTKNPKRKFTYNSYFRSMVSYFRLSFINGSYNYSIFRDYDGEISSSPKTGVLITKLDLPQRKEILINCKNTTIDDIERLKKYLSCDRDSALGCNK